MLGFVSQHQLSLKTGDVDHYMMIGDFQQSLQIVQKPSRILAAWVCFIYSLALLALLVSPINLTIKTLLLVIVFFSLGPVYKKHFDKKNFQQLSFSQSTGWGLTDNHQQFRPIRILPSSFVSLLITIIQYRDESGGKQSIIISRDSIDSETYRRLIVKLRVLGSD